MPDARNESIRYPFYEFTLRLLLSHSVLMVRAIASGMGMININWNAGEKIEFESIGLLVSRAGSTPTGNVLTRGRSPVQHLKIIAKR